MGIPPFFSPEERRRMDEEIAHRSQFIADKGYVDCGDAPYKGPDGVVYLSREAYWQGRKWCPGLKKDGVTYGWYEVPKLEGYVEPFYNQVAFLESFGYERYCHEFCEDYLENIDATRLFYEMNGFVPRWEKNGRYHGHEQLLEKYGYVYPWVPEKEVLNQN